MVYFREASPNPPLADSHIALPNQKKAASKTKLDTAFNLIEELIIIFVLHL